MSDDFADDAAADNVRKRLKRSVSAIAEAQEKQDPERPFHKDVVHNLTKVTHDWITRSLAPDLESFQRHSKRGTIGVEDVLLAARKNDTTKALIAEHVDELAASKQKKRRRSDAAAAADEDEADDT